MAPSPTKCKDHPDEKSKGHAKEKGIPKEWSKDGDRDKTQKKYSPCKGGSSTRSRCNSPSSTSTGLSNGSSSSSVSNFWGCSACPTAPIPAAPLTQPVPLGVGMTTGGVPAPNPNHPKEMKRKGKTGVLPLAKVYIRRLTRNVSKDHTWRYSPPLGKLID